MNKISDCMIGLCIGESLALATPQAARGLHAQLAIQTVASWNAVPLIQGKKNAEDIAKLFAQGLPKWTKEYVPDNPSETCLEVASRIANGCPWNECGIENATDNICIARCAPLGIYAKSIGEAAELALECARVTHTDESSLSAAVAAATVCFLAANGVSCGQWAAYAAKSSVSKEFVWVLSSTTKLIVDKIDRKIALEQFGDGVSAANAIAKALYCCMIEPKSFVDPVAVAAGSGGDACAAALTGAWMGTKFGSKEIPEGWLGGIPADVLSSISSLTTIKGDQETQVAPLVQTSSEKTEIAS